MSTCMFVYAPMTQWKLLIWGKTKKKLPNRNTTLTVRKSGTSYHIAHNHAMATLKKIPVTLTPSYIGK